MASRASDAIRGGLASVLVVGGLAACTSGPPSPRPVVEELAEGLTAMDLSGVPFAEHEAQARELVLRTSEALGTRPVVKVDDIRQDGEQPEATSRLLFRWQLSPGVEWSYSTTAVLAYSEERGWRVAWDPSVLAPGLEEGERLRVVRRQPPRADILGAGGEVLVTERPVVRVGIDKTQVPPGRAARSARSLAEVVDVEAADFAARVEAAGPKAFVEAIVLRTEGAPPVPVRDLQRIPGAVMVEDSLALAPTAEFARPVLGSVGEATAEVVEESAGRVRAGDQAGLSGLQARYDEQLAGRPGVTVEAVASEDAHADKAVARVLFRSAPVRGEPLRTTLEPGLQETAEKLLSSVVPASAIVAVRPSTGAMAVAASGPGGDGLSISTIGQYAPGSTFKVVTALAMLRAGMGASSRLPCAGEVVINGKPFENYDDYPAAMTGSITLHQAMAHSCNTAFISQHEEIGQADLQAAAAALGLGVDHDLGFPIFLGAVPGTAEPTEHAASMIGQGKVLASPAAMAGVAASVARGERVVPHLLDGSTAPDTGVERPLTSEESRSLAGMMRAVATEGTARFLEGLPGGAVAAKTGTAEYGGPAGRGLHAWMIAFRGDLAVVVFVEEGESGSRTAGPLLEDFLRSAD